MEVDLSAPLSQSSSQSPQRRAVAVSDDRLWQVLQQIGLYDYVKAQPLGLDAPVDEV